MIANQIIGTLDNDGYLRRDIGSIIDDIAFTENIEFDNSDIKKVLLKIQKLEKELKEYETMLNDKDLFKNDRKTFDKVIIEVTNIKKIISELENKWLELQILNDEIYST